MELHHTERNENDGYLHPMPQSDDADGYLEIRQVINTERDQNDGYLHPMPQTERDQNDGYLHPMPQTERNENDGYLHSMPQELRLQFNENGNVLDMHGYLKLYDVEPSGLIKTKKVVKCIPKDFKSYENDGAELGVSERNADYADHDDISLKENQPYDNNAVPMLQEEPDRIKSLCRVSNNVISMIAAVLVGCSIVICMILLCKLPGLKCINTPPPEPPTPPGCSVLRGQACYFQCRIALKSTTEIQLIQETRNNRLTLFNVINLTKNSEETFFDQKNKMTFNVSVKDADIEVSVYISDTHCNHQGNYSILAISDENGFDESFVSVNVIDHPQTPVIEVASNGIIEDKGGQISCRAMTGCNKAQFKFELAGSGSDIWKIWSETNENNPTLINLGWETQFLTDITEDQATYVDKRKFRCSYMFDREIYTSPELCIGVIPANFCQNDNEQCNYQHPYLCNKYISCQNRTMPMERPCSTTTELHFPRNSSCHATCVWQSESNCSYKDNCS